VAERADFWSALADEQGRGWTVELPTGAAAVRVDARDLAAAVDALLGNVFAHTPEGVAGCVRVLARPGGGAIVEIADSGPGLPAYGVVRRGESGSGSTGLGLDIADRTAKASGGRLEVDSAPGRGTTVRLLLGPPVG
jgi:signal transduction histidine kinase